MGMSATEPDGDEYESAEVSFAVPAGFKAPDDVQEGDDFEVVAKVCLRDGQVIVKSVNGVEIGEETEEVEETDDLEGEEEEETLEMAMAKSGY